VQKITPLLFPVGLKFRTLYRRPSQQAGGERKMQAKKSFKFIGLENGFQVTDKSIHFLYCRNFAQLQSLYGKVVALRTYTGYFATCVVH